jgi:hypothetical protein
LDFKSLRFGNHSVSGQRVLVSDLARLKAMYLHIRGILGEDFLEKFDMLVDNSHGVLCLDDDTTMRSGLKGSHLTLSQEEPTQATPGPKSLIMNVHFRGGTRRIRMMLDSGANAQLL